MASTSAVSLQTLIDEALALLHRSGERPAQLAVGSNDLTSSSSDTTFTLTGDSTFISNLQAPAVLELGQEKVLVSAKTADATPVFTGSRGYESTPISAHATADTVLISPQWGRFEVRRQILRALQGTIAVELPNVKNTTLTPVANQAYVEVPAETMRGLRLAYSTTNASVNITPLAEFREITEWEFLDDVAAGVSSTGKLLNLPTVFGILATGGSTVNLYFTYQAPYAWSTAGTTLSPASPTEAETVNLPQGSEDLPALYAAAYLATGREVTRLQLDKVEEWTAQSTDVRGQSNAAVLRLLWQEFYRRLDEAKRLQQVPRHRPYRPMRRF